ncbi:MAG: aminopeptidase, partial [Lachnospiraceae bacterium]|nr:aminopeptidase [Lachnospiraceae bacterium]
MEYEKIWKKYSQAELKKLEKLNAEYIDFLSNGKTERECVKEIVRQAEAAGYKDMNKVKKVKAGDKLYRVNKGKAIALFVVGTKPLEEGMKILGAHIDSPRLDIKQNPLYEDTDFALLDT